MFWLVNSDVLFAGFSAEAIQQLPVGGCQCQFRKGLWHVHSRLVFACFRCPEGAACWQPSCCDAPACLMAELPGRLAGVWHSPVGSWVSVKPCSWCGKHCLPTCLLCSDTVVAVTNLVTWASFISPFLCVLTCSPGFVYFGRRSAA